MVVEVTTSPEPDSLRERKRRATMVAIEDAATTLVLEHGYDAVTVDHICVRADVSKRTFFNYVPTKEAAVVGGGRPIRSPTTFANDSSPKRRRTSRQPSSGCSSTPSPGRARGTIRTPLHWSNGAA